MADAAVEFLLENLKQLLLYHARLIKDAKGQLEILENDLSMFKAFLEEHSTTKRNKNKALKQLMREIRDIVYEVEDIIDEFVTQAAENKTRNYFTRIFRGRAKLLSLSKKVEDIRPKVRNIFDKSRNEFAMLRIDSVSDTGMEHKESKPIKVTRVREDNVVGFDGEAQTLIDYLNEEKGELDVISIIGMPGLGKTTLARKVYRDPKIQNEFPTCIWVYVSQEYSKKEVFLDILGNLISQYSRTDEFLNVLRNFIEVKEREDDERTLKSKLKSKTDDELGEILGAFLEKIKFLIVMDDVWSAEAWTDLQVAFPKFNRKVGKILITSRNEEVARQANRNRDPYRLRLLTREESWELLLLEVFGKPECDPDLEGFGKQIVKQCGGMPLAIVVIGGILVKKASTRDTRAMKNAWRKVSESLSSYLNKDTRMEDIIVLSYNKLPYYLRPCFLYIGMFPEDFEIPAWQLSTMWIAEGFILQKRGISLEETAQDYLEELISRNLVMVGKISADGKIKTCRIHDMLREFCQNEAGSEKENFFQEMKKSRGGDFHPSIREIENPRRLCIHTNVSSFISSKPSGPRVRSFFSKEEILLHDNISFIHPTFKLLRVFDVQPFTFTKFPKDLTQLIHLRHIALSCNIGILPRAISRLWNLQTLIVYTNFRTLEIKANIWEMIQLRHVKTNAVSTLPKPGKSTKECEKLQTLDIISLESCTEDVFDRVRSLRKLGIQGRKIVKSLEAKGLEKLDNLEKLKLEDSYFYLRDDVPYEGNLLGLLHFLPKLRSLTISGTYLDWSNMSTLAMLDTLEVLKLKYDAFTGECWDPTDGGFRHLEVLHIVGTNLVNWTASAHQFPRLRCLLLRYCEYLAEIPFGLGENLQQLELVDVSSSAVASARKIEQAKRQQQGKKASGSSGFKLSIVQSYLDDMSSE